MKTRTILLPVLEPTSQLLHLTSEGDEKINLSKNHVQAVVYFNTQNKPHYEVWSNVQIFERNQKDLTFFDLIIPYGSKSGRVVLRTNADIDLDKITATIFGN